MANALRGAEASPGAESSADRVTGSRPARPWSGATQALLVGVGVVLAVVTFLGVLNMPDMHYHPARDMELRATYDSYRETGVLLVKGAGTGSWYGGIEVTTGLTRAGADDDPGSYIVASLASHLTGSPSPYPGLRWAMALVASLPLLLLPLTVARVLRRARAGVAMIALPAVTWLVNKGTFLVGTEYGLHDAVSPTPVYAAYGLGASLVFLGLVVITCLSTYRLRPLPLVAASVLIVLLAAVCDLMRSLSGIGVAVAVGVLWWSSWRRKGRLVATATALGAAVIGSLAISAAAMHQIEASRSVVVTPETSPLASTHTLWHSMYLGLSYPQPITGEPSVFGVLWSDEYGLTKAREVDPVVRMGSPRYDEIMKGLYLEDVKARPWSALRLYLEKTLYTARDLAGLLALIAVGLAVGLRPAGRRRKALGRVLVVNMPTVVLGLAPVVLVMPMLYYYSQLIAALGLLSAIAVGALVAVPLRLPSMSDRPARVASR